MAARRNEELKRTLMMTWTSCGEKHFVAQSTPRKGKKPDARKCRKEATGSEPHRCKWNICDLDTSLLPLEATVGPKYATGATAMSSPYERLNADKSGT